ncbi:MAG TPA: class I SAM-dependent methyltransferase [Acidimicrobiales bacterium]|nr:class I SAM-dependent methyltransferase [Acidimicrobiales bacterium]
MPHDTLVADADWAEAWQRSWDDQQEGYLTDREHRLAALVDIVEAVAGPEPLVLDLACGTGSISRRVLARLPGARTVAVDIDPALLAIASASLAGDPRVRIVRADLGDPAWHAALPETAFDAVVTATALHWLPEPTLRRLYRDLRGVVRPGGVVANADDMPGGRLPRLMGALDDLAARRRSDVCADGRPDWDAWWDLAAADPVLADAVAERRRFFGGDHADTFAPPATWHVDALAAAGFAESGIAWRSGTGAVVAAVR